MLSSSRILPAVAGVVVALIALGGCGPSGGAGDVAELRAAAPPEDFWISVTVLGPVRADPAAEARLARSLRPGRYVVEADRLLRVALGTGAKDAYFPPQTRRLTGAETAELWRMAVGEGGASLLDAKHPNVSSGNGEIDPATIEGKTVYVILTHGAGRRELVVMEVDPECGEMCQKAKGVVEWMAGKAWVGAPEAGAGAGK